MVTGNEMNQPHYGVGNISPMLANDDVDALGDMQNDSIVAAADNQTVTFSLDGSTEGPAAAAIDPIDVVGNDEVTSSVNITGDIDAPSLVQPGPQPVRRLVRKREIIPIEIQTDRTIMCTVVLRHLGPMSTTFVVTIPDDKKSGKSYSIKSSSTYFRYNQ